MHSSGISGTKYLPIAIVILNENNGENIRLTAVFAEHLIHSNPLIFFNQGHFPQFFYIILKVGSQVGWALAHPTRLKYILSHTTKYMENKQTTQEDG